MTFAVGRAPRRCSRRARARRALRSGACGRRRPPAARYSSLSLHPRRGRPARRRWRRHLPFALLAAAIAAARHRARPAGRRAERARQPDHDHPHDGRVGEHVLDRHRADPARGARAGGDRVRRASQGRDPDRARRVQRVRGGPPAADLGPGGPRGRDPEPHDRPADRDRERHPRRRSTRSPRSTRRRAERRSTAARRGAAAGRRRAPTRPSIIVVLTDGASNAGPEPVDAARQAADRGLRVYTIGFGSVDGGQIDPVCRQQFIGNEPGGQWWRRIRRRVRRRRRLPARDRRADASRGRRR